MGNGDNQGGDGGGQNKATAEAIAAAMERQSKTSAQRVESLRKENEALDNQRQSLSQIEQITQNQQRAADLRLQDIKAQQKQAANLNKQFEIQIAHMEELGLSSAELRKEYEEHLALTKENTIALEHQKYVAEGMADAQDNITAAALEFAGITGKMNLTAQFAGFVGEAGSLRGAFDNLADSMGNAASKAQRVNAVSAKLSEGITAIFMEMVRQAMALDSTESSIRQQMNVTKEYASSVREVYHANKINGITAEQAGASFSALHNQMSSFSQLNKASRTEITETAAQLSNLGVSNQAFADGMDMSTRALRMTAEEARATQTDLARFAGDLGIAPDIMASSFANAGPVLAKFGEGATKAFKNVAKTAKETGIEINRILDYTKQFDTFEGAAESVGSLNAMLGGDYINAMDLMATEDPAERMAMITDAVHAAGKSFEEMGYYEKLALAEAGNFADVEELSRAMSGNMDDNATSTEANAMSQQELAAINQQNLSLQQKLTATMAELAPSIMKVVDALNVMMKPIMWFVETFGTVLFPLLVALRIHFFRQQMIYNANARALQKLKLAQVQQAAAEKAAALQAAAGTAAKTGDIAATEGQAAANIHETGTENMSTAAKVRGRLATIGNTIATAAGTAAKTLGAAASTLWAFATGASVVPTVAATGATMGLGTALITATGGLILIIPLIIGLVIGLKKMWEHGGIAKGIVIALGIAIGVALVTATGGLILIIPLIIGMFMGLKKMWEAGGLAKNIVIALGAAFLFALGPVGWVIAAVIVLIKYWGQIKAAMVAVYDFIVGSLIAAWELLKTTMVAIWDGIVIGVKTAAKLIFYWMTWPFQLAYRGIMAVWNYFMGNSPSPFMMSIIDGIKSAGKLILDFLTWPYRMAYKAIISVFTRVREFVASVGTWIRDKIVGAWTAVTNWIKERWETMKSYILTTMEVIARVGAAILTGGWSEIFLFIYRNWDLLKEQVAATVEWVVSKFRKLKEIGLIIAKAMKAPFNAIIRVVNAMVAGLERVFTIRIRVPKILPGPSSYSIGPPNLGRIPALAQGTDNFQGGQALVGEQGPEMVNMPSGSQVAPAPTTKGFAAGLDKVAGTTAALAQAMAPLVPALAPLGKVLNLLAGKSESGGAAATAGKTVQINVTLELDKRVLAQHTEEVMLDKLNPSNA